LLLQGDSLVPLLERGDAASWDDRAVVSEEVVERAGKDDHRPFGAIHFGRWHLLDSLSFARRSRVPGLPTLRVFDRTKDPSELARWSSFSFDVVLARRFESFVRETMAHHGLVWRALTSGGTNPVVHDPASLERLRELGYL
jgi:hypothetical protein